MRKTERKREKAAVSLKTVTFFNDQQQTTCVCPGATGVPRVLLAAEQPRPR
jgi:hypothetical protein